MLNDHFRENSATWQKVDEIENVLHGEYTFMSLNF